MSNKDIVDKLACSAGYVSTIRSKMKTKSQGIASLPTVTAPPGDESEMMYQISRGRSFLTDRELAEEMQRIEEDKAFERKLLKRSYMALVAMVLLFVVLFGYTFLK
jgi:uncharacterized membrane protein